MLRGLLEDAGAIVGEPTIVPDEQERIEQLLSVLADGGDVDLVLTTGGTGLAPRDRTPEATLAVVDRLAPGFAEAMRAASLEITPHAMLSRAVAGVRGRTLIINLSGSPEGLPRAVRRHRPGVAPRHRDAYRPGVRMCYAPPGVRRRRRPGPGERRRVAAGIMRLRPPSALLPHRERVGCRESSQGTVGCSSRFLSG